MHSLLVASPPLEWACNPSQFSPHLAGFPFADGDSAIFRIFLFYAGSRLMPPSLAAYIHLLVSPPSQYGPVPHALHALRRVPYLPPSLKEQGWFCSAVAHLLTVTMAAGEAHGAKLADEVMPILMRMNRYVAHPAAARPPARRPVYLRPVLRACLQAGDGQASSTGSARHGPMRSGRAATLAAAASVPTFAQAARRCAVWSGSRLCAA